MPNTNILAKSQGFSFIGWKSYNRIKKKAMEQEFSWSGLIISLSIAFFIVLLTAQILSMAFNSIEAAKKHEFFINQRIYHIEASEHINPQADVIFKNFFKVESALAIDGGRQQKV